MRYDALVELSRCPLTNVDSGKDLVIRVLVEMCAEVMSYNCKFVQNTSKPDGTMRKIMDVSKIRNLNWKPKIDLKAGVTLAYTRYLDALSL